MERLKGQKVWIYQFDDDDDSVIGVVDSIANGFIALCYEGDTMPALFVNLSNVREIEIFREEPQPASHLQVVPLDAARRRNAMRFNATESGEMRRPHPPDRNDRNDD